MTYTSTVCAHVELSFSHYNQCGEGGTTQVMLRHQQLYGEVNKNKAISKDDNRLERSKTTLSPTVATLSACHISTYFLSLLFGACVC